MEASMLGPPLVPTLEGRHLYFLFYYSLNSSHVYSLLQNKIYFSRVKDRIRSVHLKYP